MLDGARHVAQLRGALMPYVDVLAAASTFAHARGIVVVDDAQDGRPPTD